MRKLFITLASLSSMVLSLQAAVTALPAALPNLVANAVVTNLQEANGLPSVAANGPSPLDMNIANARNFDELKAAANLQWDYECEIFSIASQNMGFRLLP